MSQDFVLSGPLQVSVKAKDSISGASGGVDDRRSTADSNESESSSGSRTEKQSKNGFSKQMKSVRQKLKRSISKLTRRTSEESDVTVAMKGTPAIANGTLEKNLAAQQNGYRIPTPTLQNTQIHLQVNSNGNSSVVQENAGYRWAVEEVKDLHGTDMLCNPSIVLGKHALTHYYYYL
jgi:hypothetical protein